MQPPYLKMRRRNDSDASITCFRSWAPMTCMHTWKSMTFNSTGTILEREREKEGEGGREGGKERTQLDRQFLCVFSTWACTSQYQDPKHSIDVLLASSRSNLSARSCLSHRHYDGILGRHTRKSWHTFVTRDNQHLVSRMCLGPLRVDTDCHVFVRVPGTCLRVCAHCFDEMGLMRTVVDS
jgi:hypothetical protein